MIEVNYIDNKEERTIRLQITGHAATAPKGQDLVCAAVTTLLLTAAETVTYLDNFGVFQVKPRIRIEAADSEIFVVAKENGLAIVNNTFVPIRFGLLMLARKFPDCIRVDQHFK